MKSARLINSLAVVAILQCMMLLSIFAGTAAAHITMVSHEARDGKDSIKTGPCGGFQSVRGDNVHTFESGGLVHLEWSEFNSHPGYFRISFDEDGHDDFVDPEAYYDTYTNDSVLVDELFQHEKWFFPVVHKYDLRLPDVECDNCTLQLIQVMTDKAPYAKDSDDLYYNCLDVRLVATPEPSFGSAGGVLSVLLLGFYRGRRQS